MRLMEILNEMEIQWLSHTAKKKSVLQNNNKPFIIWFQEMEIIQVIKVNYIDNMVWFGKTKKNCGCTRHRFDELKHAAS